MKTQVIEHVPTEFQITLHDRCDRCGFRAYFAATKLVNNELLTLFFCGHHGNQHRVMLDIEGWTILDDTDKLLARD